jgi:hypothetical protein
MSSYLTFYGVKGDNKFEIASFSRNTDIYQEFWENGNIPCSPDEKELTKDMISNVLESTKDIINRTSSKIIEYEKFASGNLDMVDDIVESKEFLEDEKRIYHQIEIFYNLLTSVEYGGKNRFDKIICTIE